MGEVVRDRARTSLGATAASEAIGQWAADHRAEYGPAVFAEYTADRIEEMDSDAEPVVDGLRTRAEVEVFDRRFGSMTVVLVTAPFETRLERLQARGRDGEDAFTAEDLAARDRREEDWGLTELVANAVLVNDGSVKEFEAVVAGILNQPTYGSNCR